MLKIIDLYIIRLFLKNLSFSILLMSSISLLQGMFSEFFKNEFSIKQIIFYYGLNFFKIGTEMAPSSALLATLLTLSNLVRTQELIACYSMGVSLKRVMSLILGIVFCFSLFLLFVQDKIIPSLNKKRSAYYWIEMKKKTDFFLVIKKNKIWYRSDSMIYHLRHFDPITQTILGMSFYIFDPDFNLHQFISTERATFKKSLWNLKNGTISTFNKGRPFLSVKNFKEKKIHLKEIPTDFDAIDKEVNNLGFREFYNYIYRIKKAGVDTKSYETNFHSRLAMSVIPLVMSFLAIPFSIFHYREEGFSKNFGTCLILTVIYWFCYTTFLSMGRKGIILPWFAAWTPSLLFFSIACFLNFKKK